MSVARQLIEGTGQLLILHSWTRTNKAADAFGNSVPVWDTRVHEFSLAGAYERAGQVLGLEVANHPITFHLQKTIVLENHDWFGGWLSAEPIRSLVSYNNKIATSKLEVLQLLERAYNKVA